MRRMFSESQVKRAALGGFNGNEIIITSQHDMNSHENEIIKMLDNGKRIVLYANQFSRLSNKYACFIVRTEIFKYAEDGYRASQIYELLENNTEQVNTTNFTKNNLWQALHEESLVGYGLTGTVFEKTAPIIMLVVKNTAAAAMAMMNTPMTTEVMEDEVIAAEANKPEIAEKPEIVKPVEIVK